MGDKEVGEGESGDGESGSERSRRPSLPTLQTPGLFPFFPLWIAPEYSLLSVAVSRNQSKFEPTHLMWIHPLVICINLLLIYLSFRNFAISAGVFSGIPSRSPRWQIAIGGTMGVGINTGGSGLVHRVVRLAVDDGVVMADLHFTNCLRKRQSPVRRRHFANHGFTEAG